MMNLNDFCSEKNRQRIRNNMTPYFDDINIIRNGDDYESKQQRNEPNIFNKFNCKTPEITSIIQPNNNVISTPIDRINVDQYLQPTPLILKDDNMGCDITRIQQNTDYFDMPHNTYFNITNQSDGEIDIYDPIYNSDNSFDYFDHNINSDFGSNFGLSQEYIHEQKSQSEYNTESFNNIDKEYRKIRWDKYYIFQPRQMLDKITKSEKKLMNIMISLKSFLMDKYTLQINSNLGIITLSSLLSGSKYSFITQLNNTKHIQYNDTILKMFNKNNIPQNKFNHKYILNTSENNILNDYDNILKTLMIKHKHNSFDVIYLNNVLNTENDIHNIISFMNHVYKVFIKQHKNKYKTRIYLNELKRNKTPNKPVINQSKSNVIIHINRNDLHNYMLKCSKNAPIFILNHDKMHSNINTSYFIHKCKQQKLDIICMIMDTFYEIYSIKLNHYTNHLI